MFTTRSLPPESVLIQRFEESLRAEQKRVADSTIKVYSYDLRSLTKHFAERNTRLVDAREEDIIAYVAISTQRGVNLTSIGHRLVSARRYFRFLVESRLVPTNPVTYVHKPWVPRQPGPTQLPTRAELDTLLNSSGHPDAAAERDSLLFNCLAMSELGIARVTTLTLDQVDLETGRGPSFRRGKRVIVDVVYRGALLEKLKDYINKHRLEILHNGEPYYLFSSGRADHLTRQSIWHMIRRRKKQAGIQKRITSKDIRRAYLAHYPL